MTNDLTIEHPAFTTRAWNVGRLATDRAAAGGDPVVDTRHVLFGLVAEGEGVAAVVLGELGIDVDRVEAHLRTASPDDDLGRVVRVDPADALSSIGIELDAVQRRTDEQFGAGALGEVAASPPVGETAAALYRRTQEEAIGLGHNYIGTEHILLAFTGPPGSAGVALLEALGLDVGAVRGRVLQTVARFHIAIDDDRYRQIRDRIAAVRRHVDELDLEDRRRARPVADALVDAVAVQWTTLYPNPSDTLIDDDIRTTFLDGLDAALADALAALEREGLPIPD